MFDLYFTTAAEYNKMSDVKGVQMKRKDSKGRVLRPGEYERRDKRYAFR